MKCEQNDRAKTKDWIEEFLEYDVEERPREEAIEHLKEFRDVSIRMLDEILN